MFITPPQSTTPVAVLGGLVTVAHVVLARNHKIFPVQVCKSGESAEYIRPYNVFIAVLFFV